MARKNGTVLDGELTEALIKARRFFTRADISPDLRSEYRTGGRQADDFYRDRWSHDKVGALHARRAGDPAPVDAVLRRLAAMRGYMRDLNLGREARPEIAAKVGMSEEDLYDMYRLLALAKYEDRYVIPPAHAEQAHGLEELATDCSLDYDGGPGMTGSGPFGESSGPLTPVAVENFRMLQERQAADTGAAIEGAGRVNLLNWDGRGAPDGLMPQTNGGRHRK